MPISDKSQVLVVEDDASIAAMLEDTLARHQFIVRRAPDAAHAKAAMQQQRPDLILLDQMLPGIDGLSFARQLRQSASYRETPIIILTAKAEERDRLSGFDAGADDYIIKPFSIKELVARMRAVLKRSYRMPSQEALECHGIQIDRDSHRLLIEGQRIRIGRAEFNLLHFFMTHPERVFTRGQLLRNAELNAFVEQRTVDVHVRRLRKLLEPFGKDTLLQTVHGVGYRFSL